jgi:hypothetical protein
MSYTDFLKAHENLLKILLVGAVLYAGIYRVDVLIQHHDSAAADVALANEKQATLVAQAAQLSAEEAADKYKATAEAAQAANAALAAKNKSLSQSLATQQAKDLGMDLPQLAQRWTQLVPSAGLSVSKNSDSLEIVDKGAHDTVAMLEQVPVLQQQLADTNKELVNETALAGSANTAFQSCETAGAALQKELDAVKVADAAELKAEKAKARKSKLKWFLGGFVAGFISRQLL